MSNKIFESLLIEKIDQFITSFSSTSTEIFYDEEKKRLFHAGEYGTYRETIVRDFLKFIIPPSLDISTGFLITSLDDVSTQCDIIVFDSKMTPIYEEGDRQRFFPIETVHCIGEVKSTPSKSQFKEAINKLARCKSLGERIKSPTIISKHHSNIFDPKNNPYDSIPSLLICKKLDFDVITTNIDSLYEDDIEHWQKHNMILSIEDGLLAYFDSTSKTLPYFDNISKTLPYSRLKSIDLKHKYTILQKNKYTHFKLFASYMFMMTSSKTLLYPEITDYMGSIVGGMNYEQI